MGREGERRRGKREAEGRNPQRRSWSGTCGGGRSGARAAAPTTFTRGTGDLRARGAPLPAQPPSYIGETCPRRRPRCACAAGSGRGAALRGTGRDGSGRDGAGHEGSCRRWRWLRRRGRRRRRWLRRPYPEHGPLLPGRGSEEVSAGQGRSTALFWAVPVRKLPVTSATCCWTLNHTVFKH